MLQCLTALKYTAGQGQPCGDARIPIAVAAAAAAAAAAVAAAAAAVYPLILLYSFVAPISPSHLSHEGLFSGVILDPDAVLITLLVRRVTITNSHTSVQNRDPVLPLAVEAFNEAAHGVDWVPMRVKLCVPKPVVHVVNVCRAEARQIWALTIQVYTVPTRALVRGDNLLCGQLVIADIGLTRPACPQGQSCSAAVGHQFIQPPTVQCVCRPHTSRSTAPAVCLT
jgi:hypothetical protein